MMQTTDIAACGGDGERVVRVEGEVRVLKNSRGQHALTIPTAGALVAVVCLLGGCKSAKVTGEHTFAETPATKPAVIYVTDFELGPQNIQHEEGLLPIGSRGPGIVRGILSGAPSDPEARARQLVDLMSTSLVKDLTAAGFTTFRLSAVAGMPTEGWLVRGVYTEVQEGNRLQRSIIGFGHGATDVQVVTDVYDLSQGPPKPLYEVATEASSGNTPGAGPAIALNPYAAAARFVMSRQDMEKNVRQTASKIAEYVARRVQAAK
jgi:hypothetical protein